MNQRIYINITETFQMFKESFYIMYLICIARDPCKKCLVRPCCSKLCSKKDFYIRLMLGFHSMVFAKTVAYFCFGSLIFSFITLIKISIIDPW